MSHPVNTMKIEDAREMLENCPSMLKEYVEEFCEDNGEPNDAYMYYDAIEKPEERKDWKDWESFMEFATYELAFNNDQQYGNNKMSTM